MAHGYIRERKESTERESAVEEHSEKKTKRKLSKFRASRHPHRVLKEDTDGDKREKREEKMGKKAAKKEEKRESIYDKSE